jgi:hypothetical protein
VCAGWILDGVAKGGDGDRGEIADVLGLDAPFQRIPLGRSRRVDEPLCAGDQFLRIRVLRSPKSPPAERTIRTGHGMRLDLRG